MLPYQDKDGWMVADEIDAMPAFPSHQPTSRKARIIPKPTQNTRTVFVGKAIPFFRGKGDITITCGNCNLPLVCDIKEGQIKSVVIKCPNCDKYNDI